jgi:hypothetical protein
MPKFQTESLQPTGKYEMVRGYYARSLHFEMKAYIFKNI